MALEAQQAGRSFAAREQRDDLAAAEAALLPDAERAQQVADRRGQDVAASTTISNMSSTPTEAKETPSRTPCWIASRAEPTLPSSFLVVALALALHDLAPAAGKTSTASPRLRRASAPVSARAAYGRVGASRRARPAPRSRMVAEAAHGPCRFRSGSRCPASGCRSGRDSRGCRRAAPRPRAARARADRDRGEELPQRLGDAPRGMSGEKGSKSVSDSPTVATLPIPSRASSGSRACRACGRCRPASRSRPARDRDDAAVGCPRRTSSGSRRAPPARRRRRPGAVAARSESTTCFAPTDLAKSAFFSALSMFAMNTETS